MGKNAFMSSPYDPPIAYPFDPEKPPQETAPPNPTPKPPHPNLGWAILWTLALAIVQIAVAIGFLIVLFGFLMAQGRSFQELSGDWLIWIVVPLGTLTNLLFAMLVVGVFFRGQTQTKIGWRGMSPMQWVLVMLSVLPMVVLSSEVTNWAAEYLPSFNIADMGSFIDGPWPLIFTAGCLLPGLGEEIYFRGFLSRGLTANHGVVLGTLFASFLFGIVHIEPVQATGAFFAGLGLQYLFLTTRSLIAPIVLHTLNNTLAFALMRYAGEFTLPGLSPSAGEEIVHTPILVLIAAVLSTATIFWMLFQSRTKWILPSGQEWQSVFVTVEPPPPAENAESISAAPSIGAVVLGIITYAALVGSMVWAYQAANR